ncbi:NAD-dependent epimerase/dehydratase family protein [Halospeciosus flavus]|uniref:NAD-dependent epimerase/dehydratase family protein n=1 Tax=Halospeciosus flavus TaxID=3032283 RepID=A0ABD5Z3L8_9EURY|nr:NAD(P)-dependent oxidoreductase [Halospeciosus flavus]
MSLSTIAVTGGNGTVGSHLLAHLAEHGYETVNLSRGSCREEHSDEYVRVDLTDPGAVHGALAKADPDAVVHLGMVPTPESNPDHETFESNAQSTWHVLEAAEAQGIERVALASSLCAVGAGFEPEPVTHPYFPIDEETPPTPSTSYGVGKQTLEVVADGFGRREGAPTQIASLRYPWVTTEADIRETFVESDRSLDAVQQFDDWVSKRNTLFTYIHIDDAVRATRLAVETDLDGHERFFLSAPDTNLETPTADVLDECFPDTECRRNFEAYEALVDTSKAQDVLGWEAEKRWRDGT